MPLVSFSVFRLPELSTIIVTDSKQPGAFQWKDLMQAGSSQHYQELEDLQKKINFDDPINIQFTSVLRSEFLKKPT